MHAARLASERKNFAAVCLFRGQARLVPYDESFDVQTVAWLNDPAVYEGLLMTHRVTLSGHRNWLAAQKDLLLWAILDAQGGHQGNVSLQLAPRHRSALFLIYIGNTAARGKGLGWSALAVLLDFAFGPLALHRVWLRSAAGPSSAANLYKKAGFVEEGFERDSILKDGRFLSQRILSLLSSEWLGAGPADSGRIRARSS